MKKFAFIFLALATVLIPLRAQKPKVKNQPFADQKIFHYGFMMGIHNQDLEFFHNGIPTTSGETWYGEVPNINVGFNVGIIGDLYLNRYLNIRTTPSLYFGDKTVVFRESNSGKEMKTSLRSNYLMIPIHLKLSSERLNNVRPYLIAGPSVGFELSRKRGEPIMSKPTAFYFEIGFGCNFYYQYFKLCPELKFCLGLNDVLEKKRNDINLIDDKKYTGALNKMTSRLIVLTFNFE